MNADGLWVPYVRRKPRIYQPRNRRDCFGELVQIDGSPHDWFEARAPKCCLQVFVDDATGQLMHLRFWETVSAFDYMLATREYIHKHGKPLVFYSDKHGIFRVNHPNGALTGTTQFGRVLHDMVLTSSAPTVRRRKAGLNAPSRRFRTGLSKKCVWKGSAALRKPTPGWTLLSVILTAVLPEPPVTLNVTARNRNPPGSQSAQFSAQIK